MVEVIEMFDMTYFLKKKGKNLSLGMLQKLRMACAFLSTANLLILDEPWNGLDIKSVISLREAILNAAKKHKKTIILTGHDISEMERLCDRFGILIRGELVEFSKKEQAYLSLESYYIALLKGGKKA